MPETSRSNRTAPESAAPDRTASCLSKRMAWKKIVRARGRDDGSAEGAGRLKVAILASFTAHPLEPYLGLALSWYGIQADVWTGPYGQIVQECLNEQGETARFAPDVAVIWPRLEDAWRGLPLPLDDELEIYLRPLEELAAAGLSLHEREGTSLVLVLPSAGGPRPLAGGDPSALRGVAATAARVREALRMRLAARPGVVIADAEEVVRRLGLAQAHDPRLLALARIPYSEQAFCGVGEQVAAQIALMHRPWQTALVLDPDELLWAGSLAERGPEGVDLAEGGPGEPHLDLQSFLLELRRGGTLLLARSCEDPDRLAQALARPEMRLGRDDLDLLQAGLEPGADGLEQALAGLGCDPDRARLVLATQAASPDPDDPAASDPASGPIAALLTSRLAADGRLVQVPLVPGEPLRWPEQLLASGWLDRMPPRAATLADETVPGAASEAAGAGAAGVDLAGFLDSLQLDLELAPATVHQAEQVAHLTEAVTELNMTGEVCTAEQLADELAGSAPGARTYWAAHISDRFGDYGIAACLIWRIADGVLDLDNMMVNCRVLGRNVESLLLGRLAELAGREQCSEVRIHLRQTTRNHLALRLLERLVGAEPELIDGEATVVLSPDELAERAQALGRQGRAGTAEAETLAAAGEDAPAGSPGLARLAERWRRTPAEVRSRALEESTGSLAGAARVLEAVLDRRQRHRGELDAPYVEPRTENEERLAGLWARMLGVDRVGAFDNFFNLGGHSILATQLILEISKAFQVELPVRIFFESPTVATMAQTIEALASRDVVEIDDVAIATHTYLAGEFFRDEIARVKSIVPSSTEAPATFGPPSRILFTGATGFFGAFALAELIKQTDAAIYCLARPGSGASSGAGSWASSEAEAATLARIRANAERYGLWRDSWAERIVPVPGDLGQPRLGLDEDRWRSLADGIDTILHGGAITNFIDPYAKLKPVNVSGSEEIIRLAVDGPIKPIHYISTLYIFVPEDVEDGHAIAETEVPSHPATLHVGYRQSKWVAEGMMRQAGERGVPVAIYRLGRLSGDSRTGACQTNDFLWRMIQASIQARCVLDLKVPMDMIPVDFVARATVYLMQQPASLGQVFHLLNQDIPLLGEVARWIRGAGFDVDTLSYEGWRRRLFEAAAALQQQGATEGRKRAGGVEGMIAFLPRDPAAWEKPLTYRSEQTEAALSLAGLTPPKINAELFSTYLDYFGRTGYLTQDLIDPASAAGAGEPSEQAAERVEVADHA